MDQEQRQSGHPFPVRRSAPLSRRLLSGSVLLAALACPPVVAETLYTDPSQTLGGAQSGGVAIADVDGKNGQDVVVANGDQKNQVWVNDGSGNLTDTGSAVDSADSNAVALGELNGSSGVDVIFANQSVGDTVWFNDGNGALGSAPDSPLNANTNTQDVALADVDEDGDLDAVFAHGGGNGNTVWSNDGSGNFNKLETLGSVTSQGVALGDVDGDGAPDALFANKLEGNTLWLNKNDGTGGFTKSSQTLGVTVARDVALADIDGDGDLDAAFANYNGASEIWRNDGSGNFTNTGQDLAKDYCTGIALTDVDGDGDPDAVIAREALGGANEVWLNDGDGNFARADWGLDNDDSQDVALGDLDGDGDPEAVFANWGAGNTVYTNQADGYKVVFAGPLEGSESEGSATVVVKRVFGSGESLTVDYATSNGTGLDGAVEPSDYTSTDDTLTWSAGQVQKKSFTVPITDDSDPEDAQVFNVDLSSPRNHGSLPTPQLGSAEVTILANDVSNLDVETTAEGGCTLAPRSGGAAPLTLPLLALLGLGGLLWGRRGAVGFR